MKYLEEIEVEGVTFLAVVTGIDSTSSDHAVSGVNVERMSGVIFSVNSI